MSVCCFVSRQRERERGKRGNLLCLVSLMHLYSIDTHFFDLYFFGFLYVHRDQATEAIIDLALLLKVPFAVVVRVISCIYSHVVAKLFENL
jgi:hypothetical protein